MKRWMPCAGWSKWDIERPAHSASQPRRLSRWGRRSRTPLRSVRDRLAKTLLQSLDGPEGWPSSDFKTTVGWASKSSPGTAVTVAAPDHRRLRCRAGGMRNVVTRVRPARTGRPPGVPWHETSPRKPQPERGRRWVAPSRWHSFCSLAAQGASSWGNATSAVVPR